MKLSTIAENMTPIQLISDDAGEWIERKRQRGEIQFHFIQRDGTVDTNDNVYIAKGDGDKLPLKFGKVKGFDASNSSLSSIEGLPNEVRTNINLRGSKIVSLSGINNVIKRIGGTFYGASNMTHILGLLRIDGLDHVDLGDTQLNSIMNKYIGQGTDGIMKAQAELYDAGFPEQARL